MQEAALLEVDADVTGGAAGAKEHQVAGFELFGADALAQLRLGFDRPGQRGAQ